MIGRWIGYLQAVFTAPMSPVTRLRSFEARPENSHTFGCTATITMLIQWNRERMKNLSIEPEGFESRRARSNSHSKKT